MPFKCTKCDVECIRSRGLQRHMVRFHGDKSKTNKNLSCKYCKRTFTRPDNLNRHVKNKHGALSTHFSPHLKMVKQQTGAGLTIRCKICETTFTRRNNYEIHMKKRHSSSPTTTPTESAFRGLCSSYMIDNPLGSIDVYEYLESVRTNLMDIIPINSKYYLVLEVEMIKDEELENGGVIANPVFVSKTVPRLLGDQFQDQLSTAFSKIIASMEKFVQCGSGWVLKSIKGLQVKYVKYQPLGGSGN